MDIGFIILIVFLSVVFYRIRSIFVGIHNNIIDIEIRLLETQKELRANGKRQEKTNTHKPRPT